MKSEFIVRFFLIVFLLTLNLAEAYIHIHPGNPPTAATVHKFFPESSDPDDQARLSRYYDAVCEGFFASIGRPDVTCPGSQVGYIRDPTGFFWLWVAHFEDCGESENKVPHLETGECVCTCGYTKDEDGVCQPVPESPVWNFKDNQLEYQKYDEIPNVHHCPVYRTPVKKLLCETHFGNPINCANGLKIQTEVLYEGNGLRAALTYRSQNVRAAVAGRWSLESIPVLHFSASVQAFILTFPNGDRLAFPDRYALHSGNSGAESASSLPLYSAKPDLGYLQQKEGLWQYRHNNTVYRFNPEGQLQSRIDAQGFETHYTYDNGRLSTVSNHFGLSLRYYYEGDRLAGVATPDGQHYSLEYGDNGLISTIVYPDDTPDTREDNPRKAFLYEAGDQSKRNRQTLLTGIVDEKGNRFATWQYDGEGRAISSEHGDGLEKVELNFSRYHRYRRTKITEWIDTDKKHERETKLNAILGSDRITLLKTLTCQDCSAVTETRNIDPETGFLISQVDDNGIQHGYQWAQDQGLPTRITIGEGDEQQITELEWHSDFRLPTTIRRNRLTTHYRYTDRGQIDTLTEEDSDSGEQRITQYHYYDNGLLKSMDGPRDDVADTTHYTWTAQGFINTITNAQGHVTQVLAHTPDGKARVISDANGLQTTLTYTPRGSISTVTRGSRLTQYHYDKAELLETVVLPDGQRLHYSYDAGHRLQRVENSRGDRIDYTLDLKGNIKATTISDKEGVLHYSQQSVFNALGQLTQQLGNHGQQRVLGYDEKGNLDQLTDALDHGHQRRHDSLNRLKASVDPLGGVTRFEYDNDNRLTSLTDANDRKTLYDYNAFGEVIRITSPDTGVTTYTYDKAGNTRTITDARGMTVTRHYDGLSRLTRVDYPNDEDFVLIYDEHTHGVGRLSRVTRGASASEYHYTQYGQLQTVVQRMDDRSYTTGYHYTPSGQLHSMTLPSGRLVGYEYDTNGQVVALTLDGRPLVSDIQYLPMGPMHALKRANGTTLSSVFDTDYRLRQRHNGAGKNRYYTYTARDNIQSITHEDDGASEEQSSEVHDEADNAWRFRYDPLERLTFASASPGPQHHYWMYNAIGDIEPVDDNRRVDVRWDENDNSFFDLADDGLSITGVTDKDSMLATHGVRSGKWYLGEITFNGLAPRMGIADQAFMQGTHYIGYSGSPGASIGYYPGTGTIRKKDGLEFKEDEYTIAEEGIVSLLLDLDEDAFIVWLNGEELGRQHIEPDLTWYPALARSAETFTLSTNFGNQPFQYAVPAGYFPGISSAPGFLLDKSEAPLTPVEPEPASFDAHGNLLEDGSNTYRYNDAGRMQQSINAEGLVTDYSYNVFEQRIKKVNSKENLHYVYYPDGLLMMEADADGTPLVEYLYLNGQHLAIIKENVLYYTHTNHLDAPVALTDEAGQIVWQAEYTPFGKIRVLKDEVGGFNARLPGQYEDSETGLHYNWHRYYDPETGRYTTSDPLGLYDGPNTYAYVGNNPVNWVDPTGLASSGKPTKVPGTNTIVRVDNPHVPGQQRHAHVKTHGKPEVVINQDGTGSHGKDPKKLPNNKKLREFLKLKGFKLPSFLDFLFSPSYLQDELCKFPEYALSYECTRRQQLKELECGA